MLWLLAKLANWGMGSMAMPVTIVGLLFMGGKYLEARREAAKQELINQGVKKCQADWEADILKQQRDTAIAEARAMRAQVDATDVLNMELKYNHAAVEQEMAKLRMSLDGADQRCLSDSVRELARGVPAGGGIQSLDGGGKGKRR